MSKHFDRGTWVVITGASSGLGAEFALQLAHRGCNLILVARREELLRELESRLESKYGVSVEIVVANLSARGRVQELGEMLRDREIHGLVNNAGVGSFGHFDDLPLSGEVAMIDLNVVAACILTQAVLPQMKRRRFGTIVNVSSVAGIQPLPYMATYGATKAFNLNYSMALRHEVKHYGVRVVAICPGPTDTEFAGVARIPGQWTGVSRDTAQTVVEESLRAVDRDYGHCFVGSRGRWLARLARLVPLDLRTAITGRSLKGSLKDA